MKNAYGLRHRLLSLPVFNVLLLGALMAAAIFLPCHRQPLAGPRYGGTLTTAHEIDASGFDAIRGRSLISAGRTAANLVMEKLFERDQKGELIPVLGLSATASEDGKTWTVKLRRGVHFHDGTPFNADAVVHHWQRLLDPKNRYRHRILLRPIQSVEKSGDDEVRFQLSHPWRPFTDALSSPGGYTAFIPSPAAVDQDIQNRSPVGTGPFVFKEWKSDDRIVVTKNPAYWKPGKPYLDQVVMRVITDHESRYAALVSGQVDVMVTDRPAHVEKLSINPNFTKVVLRFRGAGILTLNNTKPPLDDVRVRRALALAWDQKKYIQASFRNIMPYTETWFGDALECQDVNYRQPNLEKAKALITAYGKPVELEYIHSATNRGREAGVILQQMMKPIGVAVHPVPLDFPGIMKQLFSRQYDISSWVIPGAYDMGPITMAQLHSKSPWNVSRYTNAEVDALLGRLQVATDPEARNRVMCDIARKTNADAPFLYLFGRQYYLFAGKHVRNLPQPAPGVEGRPLTEIWIDK
jgi:ABC-type transport system substrate-binding protein